MKAKYDRIGDNYNQTRKADSYIVERLIHHLCPKENKKYLDIGCGTGNYTIALNEIGFDFIGVEPSTKMLKQAKLKSDKIDWKYGTAEDLPLENKVVAGVLATLTTHHWRSLEKAFTELNRVLKANGRFVIFTSNRELMKGYWLNHYFPKMLEKSMKQMPTFELVKQSLRVSGFEIVDTEKYFVKKDLTDFFLYSGKDRPELYLDKTFRCGISSFSDLANGEEVENGLKALEKDIESRKINEVIANYKNNLGDYMFIVAGKINDVG